MSRTWDQIQQDTFPEWINYKLANTGLDIKSLEDLSDGVLLIKLLEEITRKKVHRYAPHPRFLQQRIDNVNVSLQFLQKELGLKVVGCNPQDIVAGNTKQIMGIIFLLMQYTKRQEFDANESSDEESESFQGELPNDPISPEKHFAKGIRSKSLGDTPLSKMSGANLTEEAANETEPRELPNVTEDKNSANNTSTDSNQTEKVSQTLPEQIQDAENKHTVEKIQQPSDQDEKAILENVDRSNEHQEERRREVEEIQVPVHEDIQLNTPVTPSEEEKHTEQVAEQVVLDVPTPEQACRREILEVHETAKPDIIVVDTPVVEDSAAEGQVERAADKETSIQECRREIVEQHVQLEAPKIIQAELVIQDTPANEKTEPAIPKEDESSKDGGEQVIPSETTPESKDTENNQEEIDGAKQGRELMTEEIILQEQVEIRPMVVDIDENNKELVLEHITVEPALATQVSIMLEAPTEGKEETTEDDKSTTEGEDRKNKTKTKKGKEDKKKLDKKEKDKERKKRMRRQSRRKSAACLITDDMRSKMTSTIGSHSTTNLKFSDEIPEDIHESMRLKQKLNMEIKQKSNKKDVKPPRETSATDRNNVDVPTIEVNEIDNQLTIHSAPTTPKREKEASEKSEKSERKENQEESKESQIKKEEESLRQRAIIANEILQTERSYVAGLTILISSYLLPIRQNSLVPPASIRRIFLDIEVLVKFNDQFLTSLEDRMKDWDAKTGELGDIFLHEVEYLKMYTMYVNNYNESVKEVTSSRKKFPKFAELLDTTRYSKECNGLDITSYLIMPIQRIPRYVMLLNDLLKRTPPTHRDYENLKAAFEKTCEVADYVNKKKREAENLNRVVGVQEILSGKIELLEDASRRFVRDGPLIDFSGSEKKSRYYFLFNDIMVVATQPTKDFRLIWKRCQNELLNRDSTTPGPSVPPTFASSASSPAYSTSFSHLPGDLKYKYMIPLAGARLKEPSAALQKTDQKWQLMFQLQICTPSNSTSSALVGSKESPGAVPNSGSNIKKVEEKIYTFLAPSYESKLSWMGDIDECIMVHLENKRFRMNSSINANQIQLQDNIPLMYSNLLVLHTEMDVWRWKSCYAKIKNGYFTWYKSESHTTTAKGNLNIYNCTVRLQRPSDKEFAFQILTENQIYVFAADSGEKLFDWIYEMRHTIERILSLKDQQQNNRKSLFLTLPPALYQLLQQPDNQVCADCSAPDPLWSNLTSGVFICPDCYNIHKIFSNSELKCLSIGKWDDELANRLLSRGNSIVNQLLEPTIPSSIEKPNPLSAYSTKVKYIQQKYSYENVDKNGGAPNSPQQVPLSPKGRANNVNNKYLRSLPVGNETKTKSTGAKKFQKSGWLLLAHETKDNNYYFVLKKSSIYYYKSDKLGTPRGVIDIQTATLRTTDDSNIFDIITPARIYSMICPSVDDCLDWINQINAVKSKQQKKKGNIFTRRVLKN